MITAEEIKSWLNLQPNPNEGGYFVSTYASSFSSAIYYFLDRTGFSALHRVKSDMLYHFYCGDPVQMLLLYPPGQPNSSEVCVFGNDLTNGCLPMKIIPAGTWLGSRLLPDGSYALMGVSMAPAFDPAGYEIAKRDDLLALYQTRLEVEMIRALTRG